FGSTRDARLETGRLWSTRGLFAVTAGSSALIEHLMYPRRAALGNARRRSRRRGVNFASSSQSLPRRGGILAPARAKNGRVNGGNQDVRLDRFGEHGLAWQISSDLVRPVGGDEDDGRIVPRRSQRLQQLN